MPPDCQSWRHVTSSARCLFKLGNRKCCSNFKSSSNSIYEQQNFKLNLNKHFGKSHQNFTFFKETVLCTPWYTHEYCQHLISRQLFRILKLLDLFVNKKLLSIDFSYTRHHQSQTPVHMTCDYVLWKVIILSVSF